MFRGSFIFRHHLNLYYGTGEVADIIVEDCLKRPLAKYKVTAIVPGGYVLDIHKKMVVTLKKLLLLYLV